MSTDRKAAVVLLTFCAFMGCLTTRISGATIAGAPSPRTFPIIMLVLLTVLSLILLIRGVGKEEKKREKEVKEEVKEEEMKEEVKEEEMKEEIDNTV